MLHCDPLLVSADPPRMNQAVRSSGVPFPADWLIQVGSHPFPSHHLLFPSCIVPCRAWPVGGGVAVVPSRCTARTAGLTLRTITGRGYTRGRQRIHGRNQRAHTQATPSMHHTHARILRLMSSPFNFHDWTMFDRI